MKKTTWKKIVSFVLVAALVISVAHFGNTNVKAEVSVSPVKVTTETQGLNPSGNYSLSGGKEDVNLGKATDIVLVIDLSNSMEGNNLTTAKNAAIAFVNTLLDDNSLTKDLVRISVVGYGTSAKEYCRLTNSKTDLINAINKLTLQGGTNIDDAIEEAESALKNSQNDKVIVLLSDGAPTYANAGNGYLYGNGRFVFNDNVKRETNNEVNRAKKIATLYTVYLPCNSDSKEERQYAKGLMTSWATDASKAKTSGADALSDVFTGIGASIRHDIAGKDARIEAYLADYISYDTTTVAEGVSLKTDSNQKKYVEWKIGDLDKADITSDTIKFKVDASVEELIAAADANSSTTSGIRYNADKTAIIVPVTAVTTLIYTNKTTDDSRVDVKNLITTTLYFGTDIIEYSVKYYADGSEVQGAGYTGYQYSGQSIQIPTLTDAQFEAAKLVKSYYSYNNNNDFNPTVTAIIHEFAINLDHRTATVKFTWREKDETQENGYRESSTSGTYSLGQSLVNIPQPYSFTVAGSESGEETSYEYKGWSPQVENTVTADANYIALYNDDTYTYATVEFYAENRIDNVGSSTGIVGRDKAVAPENAPIKKPDNTATYTFAGWFDDNDNEFVNNSIITGNEKYYARYTPEYKKYTLTYIYNEKDSIEQKDVRYETPTAQYYSDATELAQAYAAAETAKGYEIVTYTGWDKLYESVTKTDTVTATFTRKDRYYSVKFWDDNTLIEDQPVKAGGNAIVPEVQDTDTKIFIGFDVASEDLSNIMSDVNAYAQWRDVKKGTIQFFEKEYGTAENTTFVDPIEYTEFTTSEELADKMPTEKPGKANDEDYSYEFAGWYTYVPIADGGRDQRVAEEVMSVAADEIKILKFSLEEVLAAYEAGEPADIDFYPEFDAKEIEKPAPEEKDTWTIKYVVNGTELTEENETVEVKKGTQPDTFKDIVVLVKDADPDKYERIVTSDPEKSEIVVTYTQIFTVIFKIDGVQQGGVQNVEYGKAATEPAYTVPEDKVFSGWNQKFDNVKSDLVVEGNFNPKPEEKKEEVPVEETPVETPPTPVAPTTTETPSTPVSVVYTLTIEYIFEDGTSAAAPAVRYLSAGDSYSIASPDVDGYTAGLLVVTGTMPDTDKVITVVYTKANEPEEVVDDIVANETPEGTPGEDVKEEEEEEPIDVENKGTPEGTPDEEEEEEEPIDVDLVGTPEGLPATGTAPVAVFFGIGAACIIFGGAMIIKIRRREEEM